MAFKFISFFLAVAVIGNIANGASRAKRGGITVISGVDQNGKEYGQVYKYSDDGKSDLVNRFGDEDADVPEAPIGIPNIPDFYFPPIPQIPELPPLNPQLDYNYFLNNYINLFAGMLRKPQFGGGNYAHASTSIGFDNDFDGDFKNEFDSDFAAFPWAYQDNLDIYHKTNEVALNAANQLSSKAGLNFQYRPWPEPDYASASAFVNPHDTEIRTAINNPNSGFLNSRFGFDIDWYPIKNHFGGPFGNPNLNNHGEGPYHATNSNNRQNKPQGPSNINNRFSNDSEDESDTGSKTSEQTVGSSNPNSPPAGNSPNTDSNGFPKPNESIPQKGNYHSIQTISTSHSNGGRPIESHQIIVNNNENKPSGNIDNRFSSEPENESKPDFPIPVANIPQHGNYQSVQTVSTSHLNGGRPVESHQTTLINNNNKPYGTNVLDDRFSPEYENEQRPGYFNRGENIPHQGYYNPVHTISASNSNGGRPIDSHTTFITNNHNKHYVPNNIDNRFSTDSENDHIPGRLSSQQTFVSSNLNGFPPGRFQNTYFPYGNPNLNDVVPHPQGNSQTVQTFVSTNSNGKSGPFKTTVYTNKNENDPKLESRFSDDGNDDTPNVQSSFVSSVHTNVNGKEDFHSEQITNNKGSVRKVVTESV